MQIRCVEKYATFAGLKVADLSIETWVSLSDMA